jgi:hypothetical protein
MACPGAERDWLVMLAMENATVPSGDVNDCIEFVAFTSNVSSPGAFQYN